MAVENKTETKKPRFSNLAVIALLCAIVSLYPLSMKETTRYQSIGNQQLILLLMPLFIFAAIVLGIAAICRIAKNSSQVLGSTLAVVAIVIAAVMFILIASGIVPWPAHVAMCRSNMTGLYKAMLIYANDSGGNWPFPSANNWCDLLVKYQYVAPRQFLCRESDAVPGESSYAVNDNVYDVNSAQRPADMVLLFETDLGRESSPRNWTLGRRQWYQKLEAINPKMVRKYHRNKKVYKNRWNQHGGPEILSTEHHEGQGCFIVFANGRVKFIKTENLPKLRWTANDPNQ